MGAHIFKNLPASSKFYARIPRTHKYSQASLYKIKYPGRPGTCSMFTPGYKRRFHSVCCNWKQYWYEACLESKDTSRVGR